MSGASWVGSQVVPEEPAGPVVGGAGGGRAGGAGGGQPEAARVGRQGGVAQVEDEVDGRRPGAGGQRGADVHQPEPQVGFLAGDAYLVTVGGQVQKRVVGGAGPGPYGRGEVDGGEVGPQGGRGRCGFRLQLVDADHAGALARPSGAVERIAAGLLTGGAEHHDARRPESVLTGVHAGAVEVQRPGAPPALVAGEPSGALRQRRVIARCEHRGRLGRVDQPQRAAVGGRPQGERAGRVDLDAVRLGGGAEAVAAVDGALGRP